MYKYKNNRNNENKNICDRIFSQLSKENILFCSKTGNGIIPTVLCYYHNGYEFFIFGKKITQVENLQNKLHSILENINNHQEANIVISAQFLG